ncbi:hypothetical protein PFFVO_00283 [Plasmodium falciparum Vietnam Oak-Knoll (FVO)]|uniref:Uncharacterized protein n=1 Tax=Plasmodium falciparum Vietnam Oak-Knoll (FVO) TaxID=1036723 RepID=A0A024VCK0_PLAFA|nr:hypothetical protein PFFVO_00283 [Plasmodium falciparum Vietnam Oak-Knoll (FVO)]
MINNKGLTEPVSSSFKCEEPFITAFFLEFS